MSVTPTHETHRHPRHGPRLSQPLVNIDSTTYACFIAYSPTVEVLRSFQRWPTSSNSRTPHLHAERCPIKASLDMATAPLKPRAELLRKPSQPLTQLRFPKYLANGIGIPANQNLVLSSHVRLDLPLPVYCQGSPPNAHGENIWVCARGTICALSIQTRERIHTRCCSLPGAAGARSLTPSTAFISYLIGQCIIDKSVFVTLGSFHSPNKRSSNLR